ncbi:MFS transporter [Aquimarina pacifica]|uniref:MFS transporter n=1 Tax=Aquimarina pacifica TaxID=1296415 RepID=UPI000471C143|nr:MFS transporter [Aquimarina pacifica]
MKSLRLIFSDMQYFAPVWVFASINIVTGTWVLYLPHIKIKFGFNDAQMGTLFFFMALGLLISIPCVPYINKKIGVGHSTKIGIIAYALLFNLPPLAPSYWVLCLYLLLIGIASGFTDVSMNALVSTIEKRNQQNFMSAAHGFFSLGGFIGAGVGSLVIILLPSPSYHMLLISSLIILSNILLFKKYDQVKEFIEKEAQKSGRIFKDIKPILALSILAFISMFNEGAVEHWSNLFLFEVAQLSHNQSGLGFILFSLTMTLGRFLGDDISYKIGAIRTINYGCILGIGAYLLVLSSNPYMSTMGFGFLGLGLSVIIPEIFRLAGRTQGISASLAISTVSGIGFIGFLIGPIVLGLISYRSSIIMSYVFLLLLVSIALCINWFKIRNTYNTNALRNNRRAKK